MNQKTTGKDALLKFEKLRQGILKSRKDNGNSVEERRNFVPSWTQQLTPPFTFFGGKRKVALQVWKHFGETIPNYIEPFAGGLAVLLARPCTHIEAFDGRYRELANDTNMLLLNFWRTVQQEESIHCLSQLMNFPASEMELLCRQAEMMERLKTLGPKIRNLTFCDPELAAYWLYVIREWIGAGADNPATKPQKKMVRARAPGSNAPSLEAHFKYLQIRTRNVRFFCGDWKRTFDDDAWGRCLKAPTQTTNIGTTGVFLDPPYVDTGGVYGGVISKNDSKNRSPYQSRKWAIENGNNPKFRIAYCGYKRHHIGEFPSDWVAWHWQEAQGYTKAKEGIPPEIDTIWFSPHCLNLDTISTLPAVE